MEAADGRTGGLRERWLVGLVAVGALGLIGTWMTWASFSVTTSNEGNFVATGSVEIGTGASERPLYGVHGGVQGTTVERCVDVTYTGTLPAEVRLYATPISDGAHVHLELSRGTGGTFPDCDGFETEGAALFTGTLEEFTEAYATWEDGLPIPPPTGDAWTDDDGGLSFRFRLEQLTADASIGTGSHAYVWEARS